MLPRSLRYVPQTARHSGRDDSRVMLQKTRCFGREDSADGAAEGTESSVNGLGLEEGVGVAFVADGGGGAVAGMDDGVVGEME